MLKPFQQVGVDFLCRHPHRILADDMGLGKTYQAIAACDTLSLRRVLVLCPAVARENWVREFKSRSLYDREFYVLDETPGEAKYRDRCLVMSYERAVLLHAAGFFTDNYFDVVILDESHYLKNPFAKRTAAILGKSGVQTAAKRIWALTGTPVTKDIGDLWPFLFTFGAVKCGFGKFISHYCITEPNPKHWAIPRVISLKPSADHKLKEILATVCLRRTIEEVMPELPPVLEEEVTVDRGDVPLTEEERATIERETGLLADALSSQQSIGVLEMFAKSCSTLRRYLGRQKAQPAIDIIRAELGVYYEKVVVFTVHKAVAAAVCAAFPDCCAVVTGETSARDRQEAIDRFQTDGNCKVLVASIPAAGTAITLTAAHHEIFVEREWIPAANDQAVARCHRIGQTRPVHVRYLTVANSIDEAVSRVLRRRKKDISAIISS